MTAASCTVDQHLRVGFIKLVSPKRADIGFDATSAQRDNVQR